MPGRSQDEQADGARPQDGDGAPGEVAGLGDGVHGGGQGLNKRGVEVGHPRRDTMHPVGGDGERVGHAPGCLAAEDLQLPADVVPAFLALRAGTAIQVGLDDHAVAGAVAIDAGPDAGDDADHFVPGAVGQIDERVVAERGMGVGATHPHHGAVHQQLPGRGSGHVLDGDVVDRRHENLADLGGHVSYYASVLYRGRERAVAVAGYADGAGSGSCGRGRSGGG